MKALAKRREDRYQTAREMRIDVRGVLEGSKGKLSVPPPRAPRERDKKTSSAPPPPSQAATSDLGPKVRSDPPPPQNAHSSKSKIARAMDVAPTTTIQDPNETKEALEEARKRLGTSGPPGARSNPPPPATQVPTVPPAAQAAASSTRVVVGIVLFLAVAVAVWLAIR
jgi:hypothetical protein